MGGHEAEARLRVLLLQLAALYRLTLDEVHVRAYSASLSRYSLDAVRVAFTRAQDVYPDRFPTAPQLSQLANAAQKAQADAVHTRSGGHRQLLGDTFDPNRGRLADDNPYEQLARKWERRPPTKAEGMRWLKSQ